MVVVAGSHLHKLLGQHRDPREDDILSRGARSSHCEHGAMRRIRITMVIDRTTNARERFQSSGSDACTLCVSMVEVPPATPIAMSPGREGSISALAPSPACGGTETKTDVRGRANCRDARHWQKLAAVPSASRAQRAESPTARITRAAGSQLATPVAAFGELFCGAFTSL